MKITRINIIILFLFICILLYFIFINPSKNIDDNLENKIKFLIQPKEILQKNFNPIVDSMSPINNINDNKQEKLQNVNEPKPKLYAILDKMALINNKWLRQYDTITYNGDIFVIMEITTKYVKMQNTLNGDIMKLDIFPIPKDIIFEIR